MKTMPQSLTLSIAICTYNGAKFLREQLDSLASQTRLPDEVVVGDDGSTDATLDLLADWAKTVPFPVRVERNAENGGFVRNFENTMRRCTGDVIFPSDQDDVWYPEKLAKMAAVLENDPQVGLVFCNAAFIDAKGEKLPGTLETDVRDWLRYGMPRFVSIQDMRKNPINTGCCAAVRRDWLPPLFPIPEGWYHDMWFYTLMPSLARTRTLREPLIAHRLHGRNVSMQGSEWFAEGKRNGFRAATHLYQEYRPQMVQLRERLEMFPDSPVKRRHLRFLDGVEKHFDARLAIQSDFGKHVFLWLREIVTLRYFRGVQPIRSLLFDWKEGLRNRRASA
ncbi:MAG: glycosyltransferase family 2 protein [Planctomycetia bacterium]|nr:glycosyltransferase family 2 protein [Planctomycetia bacterium]